MQNERGSYQMRINFFSGNPYRERLLRDLGIDSRIMLLPTRAYNNAARSSCLYQYYSVSLHTPPVVPITRPMSSRILMLLQVFYPTICVIWILTL
jgi:hypothetical protein